MNMMVNRRDQFGLLCGTLVGAWFLLTPVQVRSQSPPPTTTAHGPRDPVARSTAEARARLRDLAGWVTKQGGTVSVRIVDLQGDSVIAEQQPDRVLNPASNMKLVTAAAALDVLGPNFRFETGLYGDFQPSSSQLDEVVLRGHGDPSLQLHDLWRLANALSTRGIKRIGTLWVDQSRFDGSFVPPAFDQQPDEWAAFRAPVSAIAVDRNTVTLNVLPQRAGQGARAWISPPGAAEIRGSITTGKTGSGQSLQLEIVPGKAQTYAQIGGSVAEGLPRLVFERRVDDPRLVPGMALRELLQSSGVSVAAVKLGGQDVKRRITYHASAPLSVLVLELGKNSDNFYAEMLLLALGAHRSAEGLPSPKDPASISGAKPIASSQSGAAVVLAWLKQHASVNSKTRVVNGSGLFDGNLVDARLLTSVLERVYQDPALQTEYLAHLSIGGVDGTLRSRFRKLAKSRSIRAKTGTLRKAIALSGYRLRPGGAPPIVFSFIVNGIDGQHAAIRTRIDRVVSALLP